MKKKKVWDYLWDMLFILPAFVLFFAVIWYPLIKSIMYSFTNYDGMSKSFDFVGLTNYMKIFSSKYIKAGIGNTLKFAVVNCLLCNIFQLLLALVLDKKLILKRYLRVAFYVPVLLCTVVVSVVFGHIMQYNGILTALTGILASPQPPGKDGWKCRPGDPEIPRTLSTCLLRKC